MDQKTIESREDNPHGTSFGLEYLGMSASGGGDWETLSKSREYLQDSLRKSFQRLRKQFKGLKMRLTSLRKWIRSCSTRRHLDYCSGFEMNIRDQVNSEIWFDIESTIGERQDKGGTHIPIR